LLNNILAAIYVAISTVFASVNTRFEAHDQISELRVSLLF